MSCPNCPCESCVRSRKNEQTVCGRCKGQGFINVPDRFGFYQENCPDCWKRVK